MILILLRDNNSISGIILILLLTNYKLFGRNRDFLSLFDT